MSGENAELPAVQRRAPRASRPGVPPRGAAPGTATTAAWEPGGLGRVSTGINLSFLTALLSTSNGTVESSAIC